MNRILQETHKESNVTLLKARDYYFDRARTLNKVKRVISALPLLVLIALILLISNVAWIEEKADFVIGLTTVASILLSIALERKIDEDKTKSNLLREIYDVEVFDLYPNEFFVKQDHIDELLKKASAVPHLDKYQVWYAEIFCTNHFRNVLCAQMDNVIYTKYVYRGTYEYYKKKLFLLIIFMATIVLLTSSKINWVITLFPFIELIFEKIDQINTSRELTQSYEELESYLSNPKTIREINHIFSEKNEWESKMILRMIQDVIFVNREKALFIPKQIRNHHLLNDLKYYRDLNIIRESYLDVENTSKPESAGEISVYSLDEQKLWTLDKLHERLLTMLVEVTQVFEKEEIDYYLDGGTLIGAIRRNKSGVIVDEQQKSDYENGGFLFWDDDVDLVIPYDQIERAKAAILNSDLKHLVVQDVKNDPYYSPRLSTLRIRESNSLSKVAEKDSELWPLYKHNGLFLDIYSYSPILINKTVDAIFRRLLIHPLFKRLTKVENDYGYGENKQKSLDKFTRIKAKYIKRVNFYTKYAKNKEYYAYTPLYIENINEAGPYFSHQELFSHPNQACFEGKPLPVVSQPESVLEKIYGSRWYVSPFSAQADLENEHGGMWYSYVKHSFTDLKHIRHVDLKSS